MRGKVRNFKSDEILHRITPAYAGKSVAQAALNVIMRDHPRLCGEKKAENTAKILKEGSPPPMRGKVRNNSPFDNAFKDHPRLCGEKTDLSISMLNKLGSPPPMRGKVLVKFHFNNGYGITPAYAGKRHTRWSRKSSGRDHPRLCGEKNGCMI